MRWEKEKVSKRGLGSIKANFKNRYEVPQEPVQSESSVDRTGSAEVAGRKSSESVIRNGKKAAAEQIQGLTRDGSVCLITEFSITTNYLQLSNEDDLWFQTLEELKADNPELYERYSLIIRRGADKSDEYDPKESAKSLANASTLLKVCQNSLETMNAPSGRGDKVFKKTNEIVGPAKDFSDEADLVRLIPNHSRSPGLVIDGSHPPIVLAAVYDNTESMDVLQNISHNINKCHATILWGIAPSVNPILEGREGDFMLSPECKSLESLNREIKIPAPLFGGIISESKKIVRRLILDGVDVSIATELETPWFIAAALSSKSVVRLLIDSGAKITSYDTEGRRKATAFTSCNCCC